MKFEIVVTALIVLAGVGALVLGVRKEARDHERELAAKPVVQSPWSSELCIIQATSLYEGKPAYLFSCAGARIVDHAQGQVDVEVIPPIEKE